MQRLFSLLQIALGTRDALPKPIIPEDWCEVIKMAEKQSLLGICFAGIERLPKDLVPDMDTLMDWLGQAEYIKSQNKLLNQRCAEVEKAFAEQGLSSCVLKGQGVGSLYGRLASYRNSGDIDLWVDGTCEQVIDYVNSVSPNREFDGKHTHLNIFNDVTVEVHWWPSVFANPILSKKLKAFYCEQAPIQCKHEVTLYSGEKIKATDPFFDSIHVLMHIYGHYLYEGIGLRQFMDYYFVCVQDDVQQRRDEIIGYYKEFGLLRFSRSVMWVLQEVFGMDDKYLLVEPDAKGGRELLDEIMEGGNFGHASAENQVKNESTAHRWYRRAKRKVRLVRYDPIGLVCSPFYKFSLLIWKRKIIKKYNL